MTQTYNYVNFAELFQVAVVMMSFDVGNKMCNGTAVMLWLLLGEYAETMRPFGFAAHFLNL